MPIYESAPHSFSRTATIPFVLLNSQSLEVQNMYFIRTTDDAHATSGIKELAGKLVYSPEDMESVGRDGFLKLRTPASPLDQTLLTALLLVQKLNQALYEKMVREGVTRGNCLLLTRNAVKAYNRMGHGEGVSN